MIHKRLVARDAFERVVMRKRQHRPPSQFGPIWTYVEIYRHPLPGTGRSVIEGEVGDVFWEFLAISLADANAVLRLAILPIPNVAEVCFNLTGEEKCVRRCERCQ